MTCLHQNINDQLSSSHLFIWEQSNLQPFSELIVSWSAERPQEGAFLIQISAFMSQWTKWYDYAFWGHLTQYTFHHHSEPFIRIYQDTIEILKNKTATGFRVRVVAKEGANLKNFWRLHASITSLKSHHIQPFNLMTDSLNIPFKGISQIALLDKRHMRLCSPTSTIAVVHHLKQLLLPPLEFADRIYDSAFDIYGNWILNTAEASHLLGKEWNCFVTRLCGFQKIIDQLIKGFPVVVSVQGPLIGSPQAYSSGHLLVVVGYDKEKEHVLCMDPACPTDETTNTSYPIIDFLESWQRRLGLAYVFDSFQ